MAKTAQQAVPLEDQKGLEGRKSGYEEDPQQAAPRVEARSLRGTFARSICAAHGLATMRERNACDDGVPCAKLSECMGQADATIRYLELRRRLLKDG